MRTVPAAQPKSAASAPTVVTLRGRTNVSRGKPQGADLPPSLSATKAGRNYLKELNTLLLPSGIGERYSPTISHRVLTSVPVSIRSVDP